MSAAKHTPGPWSVIDEHFGTGWTDGHEIEAEDGSIARTYRGRGAATNAANARLIAAAPSLLAALEQTVDVLQEFTNVLNRPLPATASLSKEPLRQAEAAIRLAKGDSL